MLRLSSQVLCSLYLPSRIFVEVIFLFVFVIFCVHNLASLWMFSSVASALYVLVILLTKTFILVISSSSYLWHLLQVWTLPLSPATKCRNTPLLSWVFDFSRFFRIVFKLKDQFGLMCVEYSYWFVFFLRWIFSRCFLFVVPHPSPQLFMHYIYSYLFTCPCFARYPVFQICQFLADINTFIQSHSLCPYLLSKDFYFQLSRSFDFFFPSARLLLFVVTGYSADPRFDIKISTW